MPWGAWPEERAMQAAVGARSARIVGVVLVFLATGLASFSEAKLPVRSGPTIKVLSNQPDLISGGDALVEILNAGTGSLRATLNGADISSAFALRPNGRVMGLVTGLIDGGNTLTVKSKTGSATITITNYPNGGPIFSGPQIQPWPCLAGATDAQCSRPVVYDYQYMPSGGGGFQPYDPIRYTIGSGCSGGSIYQQQAANDYPGIFDGILPACSFPDSWSTAIEVVDCRLLVDYFDDPSKWAPGVAWPPNQQAAVEGHPGPNICQSWINVYGFDEGGNPRQTNGPTGLNLQSCNVERGVGPDKAYDPQTNPGGVRCDLGSYFVNELGERAPQFWGSIEQALGHGFVAPPFDNVGVQYGLGALQSGTITPEQFIDLNQKVGGRTIDYDPSPDRVDMPESNWAVTYQGGLYNEGNNMYLPIIDLRGHDVEEIHHDYRSYVMRARLERSNGYHDNQVIWTGAAPLVGDATFTASALTVMNKWLAAIEADTSPLPLATKVVKDKPAEAHDLCTDGAGNELPSASCPILFPYYAEPRMVAGEPFTGDVLKCQLKPIDRNDYATALPPMTNDQFAQLAAIFPSGVCDYSQPGYGQQPTIPWMGYAAGPGGKPL